MTVKELVNWMNAAIELRESTWKPDSKKYSLNNQECLDKLKPQGCNHFEEQIASSLIVWGNDIQDWANEANK